MLSRDVPDLFALELLDAIGRCGSLTAAAREVGITQQAASLRLRTMEARLGIALVHRSRTGATLTDAGTLLNQWASKLLAQARELSIEISSLRTDRRAHLRVASSLTVAEHLFPTWLVRLHTHQTALGQPTTEIQLGVVNTDAVIERVRTGAADLGFIESPRRPADLRVRVVAKDELVVVVRPDHPWARRRTPLALRTLAQTPLIGREPGSGSRQAFEAALTARLPREIRRAQPALEVSSAAAMRAAVLAGAGPAAISSLVVADDLASGRLAAVPVANFSMRRRLCAIWRGDTVPPAGPVRDLLAMTRER